MTERTPLLSSGPTADPEALKETEANSNASIMGLHRALHAYLAHNAVQPFQTLPLPYALDAHPKYDRIIALHGPNLLAIFPHAQGTPPASSSSNFASDMDDASLYLCALLSLLLSLKVQKRKLKAERQVDTARKRLCHAIVALLDALVDQEAEGEEEEEECTNLLFTSLPAQVDTRLSAVDLLLQTVTLPKCDALRAVTLHPVVARGVDHAWKCRLPSLRGHAPRCVSNLLGVVDLTSDC
jgi:hypothetical protein